jgi:hypothetical protein
MLFFPSRTFSLFGWQRRGEERGGIKSSIPPHLGYGLGRWLRLTQTILRKNCNFEFDFKKTHHFLHSLKIIILILPAYKNKQNCHENYKYFSFSCWLSQSKKPLIQFCTWFSMKLLAQFFRLICESLEIRRLYLLILKIRA